LRTEAAYFSKAAEVTAAFLLGAIFAQCELM